jgi:hypothetical protein
MMTPTFHRINCLGTNARAEYSVSNSKTFTDLSFARVQGGLTRLSALVDWC